jgi:hypothetical protein
LVHWRVNRHTVDKSGGLSVIIPFFFFHSTVSDAIFQRGETCPFINLHLYSNFIKSQYESPQDVFVKASKGNQNPQVPLKLKIIRPNLDITPRFSTNSVSKKAFIANSIFL